MSNLKILWADDEIDLLKPHINFLKQKNFEVTPVISGKDAIEEVQNQDFNIIFLDERMPGLSGLETLAAIKRLKPQIPVVMVTKIEDEFVMDDAIGQQIADYLIKPVNPNQLLLSIKKLADQKRLVSEKITSVYQQEFREISMSIDDKLNPEEWKDIYKKMVWWELELEKANDPVFHEILMNQKAEANRSFFKFIQHNYEKWINNNDLAPILSNKVFVRKVIPQIGKGKPVIFILIDNFRFDQWKSIQHFLSDKFRIVEEDLYFSILPTATNYARNSIFSGLMPMEIEKNYPENWVYDEERGSKNKSEEFYLAEYFKRLRKNIKFSYDKITSLDAGKKLPENIKNFLGNDLHVIIYNFIDLLSHTRTEMEVIKELAEDEKAYRSLTQSWFKHSPLLETMTKLSEKDCIIVLTTDHGSIKVKSPSKVIGDKNTTTNLRYKQGKNLDFNQKEVFWVKEPHSVMLPRPHVSSSYIFAKEDYYFIYPNNYSYFVSFFNNTFQHGGISMEEMMVPVITLENK